MFAKEAKTVLKDFSVYTFLTGLSKFSALLILPILTRFLTTEAYGVFDFLFLTATALTVLVIAGQDQAIGRFIFDADNQESITRSGLRICLIFTTCVLAVSFIFAAPLTSLLLKSPAYANDFRLMLLYAGSAALLNLMRAMCRWLFNKRIYLILTIFPATAVLLLTAVFVIGFGWGVRGAIWAQVIPNTVFAAAGLYIFRQHFFIKTPPGPKKAMIWFGIPLTLSVFIASAFNIMDKQIYVAHIGIESLGLYAVACKYALFISVPATAFIMAFLPVIYKSYRDSQAHKTLGQITTAFAVIFSAGLLGMTLIAEPVIKIISTGAYAGSAKLFLPVALSIILEQYSSITSAGIELAKKTHIRILTQIMGVIIMIATAPILLETMGAVGIPYSVLAGRLTSHIMATVIGRKLSSLNVSLWRGHGLIALGFTASLMFQAMPRYWWAYPLLLAAGAAAVTLKEFKPPREEAP